MRLVNNTTSRIFLARVACVHTVLLDCHLRLPKRMLTHFQPQSHRKMLFYDKFSIVSSICWILTQNFCPRPTKKVNQFNIACVILK